MSNIDEGIKNILGYGEEVEVLVGADENGKPVTKKYHLTPVSLSDLPALLRAISLFMEMPENLSEWDEDRINAMSDIIFLSLKKMHPNVTKDEVQKNFGLASLARSVNTVLDLNDFFEQAQKMRDRMSEEKKS